MKRRIKKDKKGIVDMISGVVSMFVFAIVVLIMFKIIISIQEPLDQSGLNNSVSTEILEQGKQSFTRFDAMYPFMMVGLTIAGIITGFLTRMFPVFLIVTIFISAIIIILSAVFSNVYMEISNTTHMANVTAELTFMPLILSRFPFYVSIMLTAVSIGMYFLNAREGYG